MIRVLHLTAHLGGGVGKALSGLVIQAAASDSGVEHAIVTFEEQEKSQFIDAARSSGAPVVVCPGHAELARLVEKADVVQLEWWNHPATLEALCSQSLPPMRLVAWSHVSGLFNPIIPPPLLRAADRFVFTSPCSYEAKEVDRLPQSVLARTGAVSSSGGFAGFPFPKEHPDDKLAAGYIGSLNFAKLHPRYVDFLARVEDPEFRVSLIGDVTNRETLEAECARAGRPELLDFHGYTEHVAHELSKLNVLVYLLNPEHYGTTENALIEAMAMGIVPVVLDNPAERRIVADGETGLVVQSPEDFAQAMRWLSENPAKRHHMGEAAARSVRERFTARNMEAGLNAHYLAALEVAKKRVDFTEIFGPEPADWFLCCQGYPEFFTGGTTFRKGDFAAYGLVETSKGTVTHFLKHFPRDARLAKWSKKITSLK